MNEWRGPALLVVHCPWTLQGPDVPYGASCFLPLARPLFFPPFPTQHRMLFLSTRQLLPPLPVSPLFPYPTPHSFPLHIFSPSPSQLFPPFPLSLVSSFPSPPPPSPSLSMTHMFGNGLSTEEADKELLALESQAKITAVRSGRRRSHGWMPAVYSELGVQGPQSLRLHGRKYGKRRTSSSTFRAVRTWLSRSTVVLQ